jgi:hypothetical protein
MPYLGHDAHDTPVTRVRDLGDDEQFVLSGYESHASKCARCVDALETLRAGRSLCERGHQYAVDVASYVFSKNGKAYSAVARDSDRQLLVRIPRQFRASRRLLLAIEEGLRVRREQPVISYDATYPVRPRVPNDAEPVTEIIERAPRTHRRVIVYPRGSPSRGSLYEADQTARVETRRYYRVHR